MTRGATPDRRRSESGAPRDTFLAAAQNAGSFQITGRLYGSLAEGKLDMDDGLRIGVFDSSIGLEGALDPITPLEDIG